MNRRRLLSLGGFALAPAAHPAEVRKPGHFSFNAREFGAAGDAKTKDTAAIQRAVDAAFQAGGGVVVLPPGDYLSGTVVLKSNVTLHIEAGAVLRGSTDIADYRHQAGPPTRGDANGKHLVFARDAENVGLTGLGRIDGQGRSFWVPSQRVPPKPEDAWRDVATYDWKPLDRPSPMVEFSRCRNLQITEITLANAPGWTLRPIECEDVVIRGIKISNPVIGPNTDGIDPTCSRNVLISDCNIDTGDDCICLKSESPYGTLGLSRNITITNCVLSSCCNGLKFGTATRGGFENIAISNCVIHNGDVPLNERMISGIAIEMVDGGWVDGVVISNVRMQRVRTPIFIRVGNRGTGQRVPTPGRLRGVMIENVDATGAILTSSITGLPGHLVEDVTLSGIRIDTEEGGKAEWASAKVPEMEKTYPEARMFGRLPAYGLYTRHTKGLRIHNIDLRSAVPDARSALVCEDAQGLRIDRLAASAPRGSAPLIRMRDVEDAFLTGSSAPAGTAAFLRVEGAKSSGIRLTGNDCVDAARILDTADDASPKAVLESGNLVRQQ